MFYFFIIVVCHPEIPVGVWLTAISSCSRHSCARSTNRFLISAHHLHSIFFLLLAEAPRLIGSVYLIHIRPCAEIRSFPLASLTNYVCHRFFYRRVYGRIYRFDRICWSYIRFLHGYSRFRMMKNTAVNSKTD